MDLNEAIVARVNHRQLPLNHLFLSYTFKGNEATVEAIRLTAAHTAVSCIEPFSETGTPDDEIPKEPIKSVL